MVHGPIELCCRNQWNFRTKQPQSMTTLNSFFDSFTKPNDLCQEHGRKMKGGLASMPIE